MVLLIRIGLAGAFLQQEAAFRSREGGLASRPDLKLKEGLQLVKDYRAVDRKSKGGPEDVFASSPPT